LYSIKELLIRPGHTIREFILGKRKDHFKPIAFVLVMSTIYFLVSKISDHPTLIDDFLAGFSAGGEERGLSTNSSTILIWLSDNYAYTTLLLIPLFSLASYISFLGLGRNYLEHIVINSYITGLQAIFYSFFMFIGVIINNEDFTVLLAVIVSILYCYWSFSQFYNDTKRIKIILRLLLTYILYVFIVGLVLFPLSLGT